ncbi:MAG: alpha-glucosidase [Frankiales bacterium]|jgi:alpha-glucosidase|nr:alpha-glucosidase [Frankiales bacterium]
MRDERTRWWRDSVVYQLYVRSFADSDGDGIGDLRGVYSKLDYLADLGVDALWLNPFYPSPQIDAGYDVADYRSVDPVFGSLDDVDAVLERAHALGLRVLVDLVPNHTSDQHPWFRQARSAAPGSPERARYLFRDGRGLHGEEPPNDWQSNFGGSAWTRVREADGRPGQWYLHLFAPEQPDLDWTNDEVRAEFESILRFWLSRGVDGFRIDVAHGLAKDPGLPDLAGRLETGGLAAEGHPHWDQDEVHEVYRAWRAVLDSYPGDPVFVGEIWVAGRDRLARYLRPDELHTGFGFSFLVAPWTSARLRAAVDETLATVESVGAPATWVLSNHDVMRSVSRFARPQTESSRYLLDQFIGEAGDLSIGSRRARAAALLMLALPGACYLYQGEELGLPEVEDLPEAVLADPTWRRSGGRLRGRDGCRVPIPWSGEKPPYGFSEGDVAEPWLPQPGDWGPYTVEAEQQQADSMLNLYRAALRLRHESPALGDGRMRWLDSPPDVLLFAREPGFACLVNVGAGAVELPRGSRIVLSSAEIPADGLVPQDTAVWLETRPA